MKKYGLRNPIIEIDLAKVHTITCTDQKANLYNNHHNWNKMTNQNRKVPVKTAAPKSNIRDRDHCVVTKLPIE